MLAHDIKTPVFVISGYAYSLKEDIDISERNFYIDNIIEEADEINDLVQKMLNFSKLDSYSMKLNKTEFDLFKAVINSSLFIICLLYLYLSTILLLGLKVFFKTTSYLKKQALWYFAISDSLHPHFVI
jgi:signal transduction histidine kinase